MFVRLLLFAVTSVLWSYNPPSICPQPDNERCFTDCMFGPDHEVPYWIARECYWYDRNGDKYVDLADWAIWESEHFEWPPGS